MTLSGLMFIVAVMLTLVLIKPAEAQIVYTQIDVSIPVGGSYHLDPNGDGVIDFTLRSELLQGWCQTGDEYIWSLSVTPASGNTVVVPLSQAGSDYASALQYGAPVNSSQNFEPNATIMAELYWGSCGIGSLGEWLNEPQRYLGLQFQASDGTHYGWAKLSTVAYVDEHGHLHASTWLSGFAYETNSGEGILAGEIGNGAP